MLKKYNQIWKRAEKSLKIELDSKPVYGDNMMPVWIKVFKWKKYQKKKHHVINQNQ